MLLQIVDPDWLEQVARVASLGILPTTMLVSWRLIVRTHAAAIEVYQRTNDAYRVAASDANEQLAAERASSQERLTLEREAWAVERAELFEQIRRLSNDDDAAGS